MLEDREAEGPADDTFRDEAPTDLFFGRQNPLCRPLAEARRALGHRVITSALPSLDVTGQPPVRVTVAPTLWLPGGIVSELPDDASSTDLRGASRRVAAAARMLGATRAVLVTDFMPGEIELHSALMPDDPLRLWRTWSPATLNKFLGRLPGLLDQQRFTSYFSLVMQLEERGITTQAMHCGLLLGGAEDKPSESNPAMHHLLAALADGSLRLKAPGERHWLALSAAETAAQFLAFAAERHPASEGSLWFFDPSLPSLRWTIDTLCALLGCAQPWKGAASALLGSLGGRDRSAAAARLAGVCRERYDHRVETSLAEHMGLSWPPLAAALATTVEAWRGSGAPARGASSVAGANTPRSRDPLQPLPRRF